MNESFRYLSCVALLLTGSLCLGQTVIVRVLDANAKPLEKRRVSISLDGFKDGKPVGRGQSQETDGKGEAKFTLPVSTRDFFLFYVDLGSTYWYCSCNGTPKIQTVIQSGIVQSAASKDSQSLFVPKPGEILIVARKFSFIERLLYPLMKD